jgi:hypothetical protein
MVMGLAYGSQAAPPVGALAGPALRWLQTANVKIIAAKNKIDLFIVFPFLWFF